MGKSPLWRPIIPRSAGVYSYPANTAPVSGATIDSAKMNSRFDDLKDAITGSVPVDGSATMTGNLPMGSNKLTGLAAGSTAGDSVRYEQVVLLAGSTSTGDQILADTAPTSTLSAGYRGLPQNVKAAAYEFVLTDSGKHVFHDEASARTYTIPANASVAFPIGTIITIVNNASAGAITLAITTDTLRRGDGIAGTGSRTIAASSVASIIKTKTTEWVITGAFS